jgi:threonine synthase
LAKEFASTVGLNDEFNKKQAGQEVLAWFQSLKATGGFRPVHKVILENGRRTFKSERVSDSQTLETIKSCYEQVEYVLNPHSAVGVAAAKRSIVQAGSHMPYILLSIAHPAKFSGAVELALKDEIGFNFEEKVLPPEFIGLSQKEKRVTTLENSWEKVREIVKKQVEEELKAESSG